VPKSSKVQRSKAKKKGTIQRCPIVLLSRTPPSGATVPSSKAPLGCAAGSSRAGPVPDSVGDDRFDGSVNLFDRKCAQLIVSLNSLILMSKNLQY